MYDVSGYEANMYLCLHGYEANMYNVSGYEANIHTLYVPGYVQ